MVFSYALSYFNGYFRSMGDSRRKIILLNIYLAKTDICHTYYILKNVGETYSNHIILYIFWLSLFTFVHISCLLPMLEISVIICSIIIFHF